MRTRDQDSWAKIVEDLTSMTGIDLKSGDGPDEVHDLLRELSVLLSTSEPGQPYTDDVRANLHRLARIAVSGLTHL